MTRSLPWVPSATDVSQNPITGTFLRKLFPQNAFEYGEPRRVSRGVCNTTACTDTTDNRGRSNTINVPRQELRRLKKVMSNERKQLGTVSPSKPAQPRAE
ncbi:hypothetical protein TUM18999_02820 [Pseudomonas tohonis]|uniref:Uncharacterized protein n=1 Tax=Pseudomonas tohonis TaxID=2725477 RepID=A0A6J4E0J3_9PSED|nr:hypothetical protein TUM18999_02820 [Pseudomonas tohonis]